MSLAALPAPPLTPSAAGRLWDLATVILNRVSVALAAAPKIMDTDRPALPERAFVSYGDIADEFGTDSLVVEVVAVRLGIPGYPQPADITAATSALTEIDIRLVREVPSGDDMGSPVQTASTLPTEDATVPVARQILADGWNLVVAIIQPVISYTFLDPATVVSIMSMDRVGPEGGAAGWVVKLEVGL